MSEYIRRGRRMSENLESVAATLVADGKAGRRKRRHLDHAV
jgi:hypothetical protein